MQKRFTVIGLGQFGARVAQHLTEAGAEVMAIDRDPSVIESWRTRVDQAIQLDATQEAVLREAGLEEADSVLVAVARDLEVSILVTALLVRLGVGHIVARAASEVHEQILRLIGAHEVINPEAWMADTVARRLLAPELHDRLVLPTGHEWIELAVPEALRGQTLGALRLHDRFGVHVIAVRRIEPSVSEDGRSVFDSRVDETPAPDLVVGEGDVLVLVGTPEQLRGLRKV